MYADKETNMSNDNSQLAFNEIINKSETDEIGESEQKKSELVRLLRSWRDGDEGDEQEQQETWEALKQALDESRLSNRKLFP
jgi:hypothetical protein